MADDGQCHEDMSLDSDIGNFPGFPTDVRRSQSIPTRQRYAVEDALGNSLDSSLALGASVSVTGAPPASSAHTARRSLHFQAPEPAAQSTGETLDHCSEIESDRLALAPSPPPSGVHSQISSPSAHHFTAKLGQILGKLKTDFGRLSFVSMREVASSSAAGTDLASLDALSPAAVRGRLAAELVARGQARDKIAALESRLQDSEERLSVSTAVCGAQAAGLAELGVAASEMATEMAAKERDRIQLCQRSLEENAILRRSLQMAQRFSENLVERCNVLEDIAKTSKEAEKKMKADVASCEEQNRQLSAQCVGLESLVRETAEHLEVAQQDKDRLISKIAKLESDLRDSNLSLKEASASETAMSEAQASSTAAHAAEVADLRRDWERAKAALIADWELRIADLRMAHQQRGAEDAAASGRLAERLRAERSDLRRRVSELEGGRAAWEEAQSEEIRRRLAAKYRELLDEFQPPTEAPAADRLTYRKPSDLPHTCQPRAPSSISSSSREGQGHLALFFDNLIRTQELQTPRSTVGMDSENEATKGPNSADERSQILRSRLSQIVGHQQKTTMGLHNPPIDPRSPRN